MHAYMYTYIHIHSRTYMHIHAYTSIHMHIHAYTSTYMHIHAHTCIYIHIHPHTSTWSHPCMHACIQGGRQAGTDTDTQIDKYKYTDSDSLERLRLWQTVADRPFSLGIWYMTYVLVHHVYAHNIHSTWLMSRSLPLRNYVGRGPVDVILKSSDCAQMIFGIVRKVGIHRFRTSFSVTITLLLVHQSTIFGQTGVVKWKTH